MVITEILKIERYLVTRDLLRFQFIRTYTRI